MSFKIIPGNSEAGGVRFSKIYQTNKYTAIEAMVQIGGHADFW